MRISTITWLAAIIICCYWLGSLATAYHQAIGYWLEVRNNQSVEMLYGKR